jgi:hypothetical protein
MNVDVNALALLGIAGAIALAVRLLLNRLDSVERTLNRHGHKLVRIETKLGIYDGEGPDPT